MRLFAGIIVVPNQSLHGERATDVFFSNQHFLARPVTFMLYRSSAYDFISELRLPVSLVFGAQFVKVTSAGLMAFFLGFIAARELVLKKNAFRFLALTRGARLAGSMIKPPHNQSLHGSGPRSLFVFTKTVSPAP